MIVLSGAILMFVLLYFAPKTESLVEKAKIASVDHNFETHVADFKAKLPAAELEKIVLVEKALSKSSNQNSLVLIDSLIGLWDLNKNPAAASIYAFQKAEMTKSVEHWQNAGERSFYAARFVEGHLSKHIYEQAIKSYEEVLKVQPGNLDSKINLAVCFVENSVEPMKGILLLREVLEVDSLNVKAHLNLGYFSLKSGQFNKAIDRFEKVIEIKPDYMEAYLYMGDVYETKGDNKKAIECYEKYRDGVDNASLSAEIANYIEKLKIK